MRNRLNPHDYEMSVYSNRLIMKRPPNRHRKGVVQWSMDDPQCVYWKSRGFWNRWCQDCWLNQVLGDLGDDITGLIRGYAGQSERPGYVCNRNTRYQFRGHSSQVYPVVICLMQGPCPMRINWLTSRDYVDQLCEEMIVSAPSPHSIKTAIRRQVNKPQAQHA